MDKGKKLVKQLDNAVKKLYQKRYSLIEDNERINAEYYRLQQKIKNSYVKDLQALLGKFSSQDCEFVVEPDCSNIFRYHVRHFEENRLESITINFMHDDNAMNINFSIYTPEPTQHEDAIVEVFNALRTELRPELEKFYKKYLAKHYKAFRLSISENKIKIAALEEEIKRNELELYKTAAAECPKFLEGKTFYALPSKCQSKVMIEKYDEGTNTFSVVECSSSDKFPPMPKQLVYLNIESGAWQLDNDVF